MTHVSNIEDYLNNVNENHTLYVVYLKTDKEVFINIGKLGMFTFPRGTYLYVGSAKRNIVARLKRHVQVNKTFRWHFDYLRPYGEITKIETYSSLISECQLRRKLQDNMNGHLIIKGFGSSDCKCVSHLIFIR